MTKVKKELRFRVIVLLSLAGIALFGILAVLILYIRGWMLVPKMERWKSDSGYTKSLDELKCSYHLDFVLAKDAPDYGTVYLNNEESYKARMVWWTDDNYFVIVVDGIKGCYRFTA
ncbi:MAG: hypothetical protein K2N56_03875 [Oscillospiraceae bacterium]|nr:hypothetical protein [Oscillospiraceae bacterium]